MPLWKIAWRSIQRRALASGLTAFSMALGVMLVVAVLLIHGVIAESFRNNSSLGYNLIIGAKGGRLQLVLNTVFYLSEPVENIPYTFYQEFLSAEERGDGQDGRWKDYVERVVPICMGDYFQQYRVVGTTPKMFDNFIYNEDTQEKYEFAAGRNFQHLSDEYGYFEAVIGATVARETGLKVGDSIESTHGSTEGERHGDQFYIVGILAPSGTPNDRAVFVNMEGFYLLKGHAKPVEGQTTASALSTDVDSRLKRTPLPIPQREVTALLVKTSPIITRGLSNTINEGPVAQAVFPVGEISSLFSRIVQPFQRVLLALTVMICIVSGISILVSIYNSMSDRRREIAIMRSLGAGRYTVMAVVLLEAVILSLGGGLLGWLAGHGLIAMASPLIEAETGVTIGLFDFAPAVNLLAYLTEDPIINLEFSTEWILVPGLILLAIAVGFLPAVAAYRTDVADALSANP
jgi:putative ABC transport system permease protein